MGGVQMPVTPSKLKLKVKNQNKTINLINEGEVNILKSPGLTGVEFDLLIPQVKHPFANYPDGFKTADYYLNLFELLKTEKKPFQFICSRTTPSGSLLFDTNMTVSLEEYSVTEDAENGLDLNVAISLLQYKAYGTKLLKVSTSVMSTSTAVTATVNQPREATSAPKVSTYIVKSGDSLWNIAKLKLGDGSRWQEIYDLNKDKIVSPNLIYADQTLILPS
jgi:LysM repeat protein